jgi:hypothetical protein
MDTLGGVLFTPEVARGIFCFFLKEMEAHHFFS